GDALDGGENGQRALLRRSKRSGCHGCIGAAPKSAQQGSKNREKARLKVARLQARMADRRRDVQHQLTTRLIRPEPAWSGSSRWPSRACCTITAAACAIADVGWGELLRQLEYKARWYGCTLIAVNRSLS